MLLFCCAKRPQTLLAVGLELSSWRDSDCPLMSQSWDCDHCYATPQRDYQQDLPTTLPHTATSKSDTNEEFLNAMRRSIDKKLRKQASHEGTSCMHACRDSTAHLMEDDYTPVTTKEELIRVYREAIKRGELASLCMKTKKGRETLTLSVMVKSKIQAVSPASEAQDGYIAPDTTAHYYNMGPSDPVQHHHQL